MWLKLARLIIRSLSMIPELREASINLKKLRPMLRVICRVFPSHNPPNLLHGKQAWAIVIWPPYSTNIRNPASIRQRCS